MLTQLSIQNILLIQSCEIPFVAGLNALTGETGAGKSILLDALGLVLGERGEAGLVRSGADAASVTAEFDITRHAAARALLTELELGGEGTLVIRRTLSAEGKSRAFINDAPVAVATLKRFGELLIARHGQHDQRGLLDTKTHRALLDQFAGHGKILAELANQFTALKAARAAVEELRARAEAAAREEEWLRRTAEELTDISPQEGEEEELLGLRKRASDAKASTSALSEAISLLTEEGGAALQLRQVARLIAKLPQIEEATTEALSRAESEIEELSVTLERHLVALDIDPRAVERAEDRLHVLRSAARKYNVAVALLADFQADVESRCATLTNLEAEQKRCDVVLKAAEAAYRETSMRLHSMREKAAESLTKAVVAELKPLKMGSTQLRVIQTELPPTQWGAEGMHSVAFEVATNAGMPFGALGKVASGGELSRLLLALKVVLREGGESATAIFDEIDAGTGGAVAEAIGLRLKGLAVGGQVLVVTHLPQVAALASHHLFIEKSGTKSVTTHVRRLDAAARAEELARMLSGATITAEARITAAKMLEAVG